jgi:hypothetical protein
MMAASLLPLNIGCTTRVVSQILAYQHLSSSAWHALIEGANRSVTAVSVLRMASRLSRPLLWL